MKATVLCLTVLGLVSTAVPTGVYHQAYNYKASSSSFRNNELQHKTDDEGYYSKDGDLEGRTKPRIQSNSEHSEYVNPKLQDYNTGFQGGANGDMSSYGQMRAENSYGGLEYGSAHSGSQFGGQHELSEGMASSDNIAGARNFGTYGSSHSSYGSSSAHSSSLQQITSRLQHDLERDLDDAFYHNSAFSQSELENELRRNLTQRIQQALLSQYGQQSIRSGMSYTISGGRLQATPNYEQQELVDLQRQLENNLLQRLRTDYRRRTSQSQTVHHEQQSGHSYDENYVYTTTHRPVYTTYRVKAPLVDNRPVYTDSRPVYTDSRPIYTDSRPVYTNQARQGYSNSQNFESDSSNYQRVSNVRYTPVPNPESITTIASNVQHEMDARLNQLLDETQQRYFNQDTRYSLQNIDQILEGLREELRSNISYKLDEVVRRQYGQQTERNGYMYTLGPSGQYSDQSNYRLADLESLRRQVETNLIEKLNRDFQTYRTRFQSKQAQVQQETHGYNEYTTVRAIPFHHGVTTPIYDDYYENRPTSASIVPLIGANVKGGQGVKGNRYNYVSAGSHSGYEASSSSGTTELQSQLQTELSRQLQAALNKNRYNMQAYTAGGYSSPSYDQSYDRLYDELNRNLTRQLREYEAQGSYSVSGSGMSNAQLESMRAQLQSNLASQLQQGLRQFYSSSSSYRASSSSSSAGGAAYRQVRGSDPQGLANYGQYRSGGAYNTQGDDCVGDDPNAYHDHYRAKRSYGSYGYRSRPLGLSAHGGTGSSYGGYNTGYNGNFASGGDQQSLGRHQPLRADQDIPQVEDNDLTQQVETDGLNQHSDNDDLTQQIEDQDLTQQIENGDLTQQVESDDLTQQIDNHDLTQQVEDHGIGQIEIGGKLVQDDLKPSINQANYNSYVKPTTVGKPVYESTVNQKLDDVQQQLETEDFGQTPIDADFSQQAEVIGKLVPLFGENKIEKAREAPVSSTETDHILGQQQESDDIDTIQVGNQIRHSTEKNNKNIDAEPENSHQQTAFLGQSEDADLSQVEETFAPANPLQSNTNSQAVDNSYTSTAYLNLQKSKTDYQHKSKQQLVDKINKILQKSIHDNVQYSGNPSGLFQKLSIELSRNITKEIEKKNRDFTFSTNFNKQEIRKLQEELEFQLKQDLKQIISSYESRIEEVNGATSENLDVQKQEPFETVDSSNSPEPTVPSISSSTPGINSEPQYIPVYPQYPHPKRPIYHKPRPHYRNHYDFHERERNQHGYSQNSQITTSTTTPQTLPQEETSNVGQAQEELELQSGPTSSQYYPSQPLPPPEPYLPNHYETSNFNHHRYQPFNQHHHSGSYHSFHRPAPDSFTFTNSHGYPPYHGPYNSRPQPVFHTLNGPANPQRPQIPFNGPPQDAYDYPTPQSQPNQPQKPQVNSGISDVFDYPTPQTQPSLPTKPQVNPGIPGALDYPTYPLPQYQSNLPPNPQINLNNFNPVGPKPEENYPQNQPQSGNSIEPGSPISSPDASIDSQVPLNPLGQESEDNYPSSGLLPQNQAAAINPETPDQSQFQIGEPNFVPRGETPKPVVQTFEYPGLVSGSQVNQPELINRPVTSNAVPSESGSRVDIQANGNINTQQQSLNDADLQSYKLIQEIRRLQQQRESVNRHLTQNSNDLEEINRRAMQQEKIVQQIEEDLKKELSFAIDTQYNNAVSAFGGATQEAYQYCFTKLDDEIKNNLTELIAGAGEPGLSKYSELISGNFNQMELIELQKYLENCLSISLKHDLQKAFNINKARELNINNAHTGQVEDNFEIVSEIPTITPQRASEILPVQPGSQTGPAVQPAYSYNIGVKGGRRRPASNSIAVEEKPFIELVNVDTAVVPQIQDISQPTSITTTTELPPNWWQRFKTNVKQGASNLKQKIVGS